MSVSFHGADISWICVESRSVGAAALFLFQSVWFSGLKCSDHDFKYFSCMFEKDDIGHYH